MNQMRFDFSGSKALQGDEEFLEPFTVQLSSIFPRLTFGPLRLRLKGLWPEPKNIALRNFQNNSSHADVPVFRHGELVCIIELGGSAHFRDEKQKIRDKRKDRICQLNEVNLLRFSNSVLRDIGTAGLKKLLKKGFYNDPGKFWETKTY